MPIRFRHAGTRKQTRKISKRGPVREVTVTLSKKTMPVTKPQEPGFPPFMDCPTKGCGTMVLVGIYYRHVKNPIKGCEIRMQTPIEGRQPTPEPVPEDRRPRWVKEDLCSKCKPVVTKHLVQGRLPNYTRSGRSELS